MADVNAVGNDLTGSSGSGGFVGQSNALMFGPKIDAIAEQLGNDDVVIFNPEGATGGGMAIGFQNKASGTDPYIVPVGADSNRGIVIRAKGTGFITLYSAATAIPFVILSGTSQQHSTSFSFSNTAASRTVTFQDADGTVAYLTDVSSEFTSQSVVTGSRSFATNYQNTTGKTMFVTVSVSNSGAGVGTVSALTDSNTTPTTTVASMNCNPSATGGLSNLSFMVLNNNYYRVNSDTIPLAQWTEWS